VCGFEWTKLHLCAYKKAFGIEDGCIHTFYFFAWKVIRNSEAAMSVKGKPLHRKILYIIPMPRRIMISHWLLQKTNCSGTLFHCNFQRAFCACLWLLIELRALNSCFSSI
jgi:hypothetical protein